MAEGNGGPSPELESSEAQRYFRRVEETFVELRGAPMLLSPRDWQVARRWFEGGIPVDHVERTLRELFDRRRERGTSGRVQSLSYFADAVESAWQEASELSAVARRGTGRTVEPAVRLRALAQRLPIGLPELERWRRSLTSIEGDAEQVEGRLAALEEELLDHLWRSLPEEERRALEGEVETAVAGLSPRVEGSGRHELAARLRAQKVRRRFALPTLSLFAIEDDGGAIGGDPGPEDVES